MGYFNDSFMEHTRKQLLRSINVVEVQVDGEWHRGEINQKEVVGDTLEMTVTFPTLDSMTCKITASRIIDIRGEVAAYQQRMISKASGQGTMIKITIPLREVSA